jgi:hypothetical protein
VKHAHVSGNLDAPEGGFDAIMQSVVCKREIGWRDHARRLLVFSTDAGFHYAGDGKLGGVITPNDGLCHMQNDMYTHSEIQDYPSISQINLKVKENSINIIFAVTASQYEVYKKLSSHIEGSSSAVLSEDSSNIVNLVRDEYEVRKNLKFKEKILQKNFPILENHFLGRDEGHRPRIHQSLLLVIMQRPEGTSHPNQQMRGPQSRRPSGLRC